MSGRVLGIAVKSAHRAPMVELTEVQITKEAGLQGDYKGVRSITDPLRAKQVLVLSSAQWKDACDELGVQLPWTDRRGNIFVSDLVFCPSDAGRRFSIGDVILEITKEATPCHRMDEAYAGLQKVLKPDWRAGVKCKVIRDGTISVGYSVRFLD